MVVAHNPGAPVAVVQGRPSAWHESGGSPAPAGQPRASCAWQRFLPFFPSQMPEQHWEARLQGSPTFRQPYAFGFAFLVF